MRAIEKRPQISLWPNSNVTIGNHLPILTRAIIVTVFPVITIGVHPRRVVMATITPTNQELQTLEALRVHRRAHREGLSTKISDHVEQPKSGLTTGQKISDAVAKTVGSWKFIIIQSICIMGWITYNSINNTNVWDPYPYILLNLMLSFQAAYTAPAIMMSQNRLSEIDRQQANNDFEVNVKAELEIELLHQKIDMMKEKELYALTKAVEALSQKLDRYSN
ncbi:MAG: hypothetical protein RLZZ541_1027 [Pseudomonadota bacterium]|jgi:uncharacterized membrane protein